MHTQRMNAQHTHVDEISVWSWVAAAAFAVIALAAAFLATQDKNRMTVSLPALPYAHPALMPQETIADPRA